jgi:methylated-DNA-[protein]-cysteine S-methyltransferase
MPHKLRLLTETLLTPIGKLVVIADEMGRLRAVDWIDYDDRMRRLLARHYGVDNVSLTPAPQLSGPAPAIAAYFDGDLHAIDSLPATTEGTPFQKRVWQALREIPAGRTVSYGELARHIGQPGAVRAVGLANGANPIGIVVPCHRVIGTDGSLTGYGGGLERKRWLLDHETQAVQRSSVASASHQIGRQNSTMRLSF